MPKTNANDMVMAWLDMKIHENPDSFDAINAENCLALIRKQRKQLISLGAHFCNLKKQRDRLMSLHDKEYNMILKLSKDHDCRDCPLFREKREAVERQLNDICNKTIVQEPVPWWAQVTYNLLQPTCCETRLDMNKE